MRFKKGFTLAEVLVTLMIIGVIAAITIPGLRKNAEQRELIAGCKKAYSTISQAIAINESEYGAIQRWPWKEKEKIAAMLTSKLNITKYCGNTGNCFGEVYQMKSLRGVNTMDYNRASSVHRLFITADGMTWVYSDHSNNCTGAYGGVDNSCAGIEVDVNGVRKPNKWGIDMFGFIITKEGVFPVGAVPGSNIDLNNCANLSPGHAGVFCTARVLLEGKISY